ncbi:MAG: GHMP kinase, partial [Berkelbacteria bacterium GW2011_GWA2_35_9]
MYGRLNREVKIYREIYPLRILDLGGWTDTWFSKYGNVCNISVLTRLFGSSSGPFRGIDIIISQKQSMLSKIVINAMDLNFDLTISLEELRKDVFDHQNLLASTLSQVWTGSLSHFETEILIMSPVEPGASMGTSATVSGGLLDLLEKMRYKEKDKVDKKFIVKKAFSVEKTVMRRQTGTQDYFSAVFGLGAQKIIVTDYPNTDIEKINLSLKTKEKLEAGLVTVFIGRHDSSDTHLMVIKRMEEDENNLNDLEPLRQCAVRGADALANNDLIKYGECLSENTNYQKRLHPDLV